MSPGVTNSIESSKLTNRDMSEEKNGMNETFKAEIT